MCTESSMIVLKKLQDRFKYYRIGTAVLVFLFCWDIAAFIPPALAEENSSALIKGEGFIITSEHVRQVKNLLPPGFKTTREELLRLTLEQRLFGMEAVRLGLDKDEQTAARLQIAYDKILADAFWKNHVVPETDISDDVLLSYYESNQDKFTVPAQVHLLWVASSDLQTLEDINKGLKAGAEFNKLVRDASVHKIPLVKGPPYSTGWQRLDKMPKQLREAVSAVRKGGAADPVSFGGLYYVFYMADQKDEEVLRFSDVKKRIKEYMVNKKKREIRKNILKELKSQHQVADKLSNAETTK
ncbi:MAG: peptidyl-prolyl cis-trans isomerase [Thermodesulfobacteriota bacterium]|nr:peptidyl-prolyl cis-trans isomerase [Thermodesulfobacteriota bacterium]